MTIDHDTIYFKPPKTDPEWGKFKPIAQFPLETDFNRPWINGLISSWVEVNGVSLRRSARREGLQNLPWTEKFQEIYEVCRKYSSPSIVVFGSGAYKAIDYHIQLYTNVGWYGYLTGIERGGRQEVNDIDLMVHSKAEPELSEAGLKFIPSRSDKNLAIATVSQRLDNGVETNLQVHVLRSSDDNPLITHARLSPTQIMATCLVWQNKEFKIIDPYDALSKGPWQQEFPMHLFDVRNKSTIGESRAINNALMWAMSTPFFPNEFGSLNTVKSIITTTLEELNENQFNSLAEKYLKMDRRRVYCEDLFEESTCYSIVKLAKLGFLPKMMEIKSIKESLLVDIGIFIMMQHELKTKLSKHLPTTLSWDDIDDANFENIENATNNLDWYKITKSPLPKPS